MKAVFPDYLKTPLDTASAEMWRLAFPLPFRQELERNAKLRGLDLYLVAGLIRQESEFTPGALSRANAYGLMQVMPATGRQLARQLKLGRFRNSLLHRPDYNLRLGTVYFRSLLDQHEGSVEAALASYNGGKTRADAWLTWATYREPAEFVETIPITETRTYVQAVLRNAWMYRRITREAPSREARDGVPPPLPAAMLQRAGKWIEARDYGRALTEYESLVSQLGGTEREFAQVRAAEARYLSGDTSRHTPV